MNIKTLLAPILFGALLYAGCADKAVTPDQSSATQTSAYDYTILQPVTTTPIDFSELSDASMLIVSGDPLYSNPPDSGKKDPPIRPDSGKKDPPIRPDSGKKDPPIRPDSGKKDPPIRPDSSKKDTNAGGPKDGPLRPVNIERILQQLNLTEEQKAKVRECIKDYRDCIESANKRYNAARRELYNNLQQAIERLRKAVADGTMTKDDARKAATELQAKYKRAVEELTKNYQAATQECWTKFERCLKSVLTDEQWRKWQELNGKK